MSDLKDRLQITPAGATRYYRLLGILDQPRYRLSGPLAREFLALQDVMVLHPLDYVYLAYSKRPRLADYLTLVKKGYAQEVKDSFSHLVNTLKEYDSSLLPIVQAYNKIAHQEIVSNRELDLAISTLISKLKEEQTSLTLTTAAPPCPATEVLKAVGTPETRADKVIALDTAMSRLHFDPDLLRTLPKRHQPIVGQSIRKWLDQLAGGPE